MVMKLCPLHKSRRPVCYQENRQQTADRQMSPGSMRAQVAKFMFLFAIGDEISKCTLNATQVRKRIVLFNLATQSALQLKCDADTRTHTNGLPDRLR